MFACKGQDVPQAQFGFSMELQAFPTFDLFVNYAQ